MILKEIHNVPYVGHLGYQKMVAVVKSHYYWPGMKKEVVDFISRILECQKVKVEHKNLVGLLQPFLIPKWKWEVVAMDFITKLPRTKKKHDSIMVMVDKLIKAAHLLFSLHTGLHSQQSRVVMPMDPLHQDNFLVLTIFFNESATFFKVSTFINNTLFSSTMSLTK
jgi:hypothetical protein